MSTNVSMSMIPPWFSCWPVRVRLAPVRVWRLAIPTPSTITRPSSGSTRSTRPSLPRSLPEITRTRSSRLMSTVGIYSTSGASEMIFMKSFSRSSRATGPKMRVSGVVRLVAYGVVVEADVRAGGLAALLGGSHDDGLLVLALLLGLTWQGVRHGGDDHVADAGVAASGTPEHADAQDLFGPRVV